MADMRFDPEVLEVPAGNTLVIELSNDDAHDVHDLVLANGVTSGRLQPGKSATVEAGTIEHDLEGWCSIVGHRAMGMTLQVRSEEHTSELQSRGHLVCRLLLEKKKPK